MVKKKENNLKLLAKGMLFRYVTAIIYIMGMIALIFDNIFTVVLLGISGFVTALLTLYYELRFIRKELKGE